MNTYHIGLSSGSAPELSAIDLIKLVYEGGGDTVDLRVGKGHRWEDDGLQPFIDAGMQIAFIGISAVLGDEHWDKDALKQAASGFVGYPLKVFAKRGCMNEERRTFTKHQVHVLAEIAGGADRVLAETHHGFSEVDELLRLHEETGAHLLLDTMGLARITDDPIGDTVRLAPLVRAVQVKGFDWSKPGKSRHMPLSTTNLDKTAAILRHIAGRACTITVETKAGSAVEDLDVLNSLLPISLS
ncbi:MAG: hypothetical protein K6T83_06215 [Alicyclobacillus sp.]|nr:hypothetical protein [Alicyclobacillus sp.]